MGTDKALLPLGAMNLLQSAIAKAKEASPRTVIVGRRDRYAQFGAVVEDIIPGCGPLSGIHAALATTVSELNLMLSVDMPFMSADFLRWLLQLAATYGELAVVPEAHGRTQPLCSVFRRAALREVECALRENKYRVDRLFSILPTRLVPENDWRAAGFSPDIFRNVNTPEEYAAAADTVEETLKLSVRAT